MNLNPTNFTKEIRMRASQLGARLFRRNVGMGWIGNSIVFKKAETVSVRAGDVLIREARPFHNGTVGQYDTHGWRTVVITPDMVGKKIAQVVEIEAKLGSGRETREQVSWGETVRAAGGIAGVARSLEDVDRIFGQS